MTQSVLLVIPGKPSNDASCCEYCPTGQYFDASTMSCQRCQLGQEPSSDRSSCQDCPAGRFSGTGAKCTQCPSDSQPNQASKSTECLANRGYYPANSAATKFDKCPLNQFSANVGEQRCTRCEPNTVTLQPDSTSAQDCVCSSGFYDHTVYDISCAHDVDFGSRQSTTESVARCVVCPPCAVCPVGAGSIAELIPKKNYFMWNSNSSKYSVGECETNPNRGCTATLAQNK